MYRPLLVATCIALSACSAIVPPAKLATPERLTPIQSTPDQSKTIFVASVAAKLIDRKIGQNKDGTLCVGGSDLIWSDNQGVLNAMREQISGTLAANGYKVYSSLIQASGEKDADIVIGAAIEDIKANICNSIEGKKGAASLTLRLEVHDNATKNSVFLSASGAAEVTKFSATGDPDVFVKSVEMATQNILAQPAFFQATRR